LESKVSKMRHGYRILERLNKDIQPSIFAKELVL